MFKLLLGWFLASYSIDTLFKGYNLYNTENKLGTITNFIYHQQEREDKLREQCNLEMYVIPPKKPYYLSLLDTYFDTDYYLNSNYYISSKMEIDSYDDFIENSYIQKNKGTELIYKNNHYILVRPGVKPSSVYSYSNQHNEPFPYTPIWSLKLDNHTLTISNIE